MQITKTYHTIKTVPEEWAKPDNGLWFYASVEEKDSMDDIVRVDGINYSNHFNPDQGVYIPILAQHLRVLADGSAPILGRIERFQKTMTNEGSPALACMMTWADTELARKYKSQYDTGYMTDFSVGMISLERKSFGKNGFDYVKTQLMEVSCVTIGANPSATTIRSLDQLFGDQLDHKAIIENLADRQDRLEKTLNELSVKQQIEDITNRLSEFDKKLDLVEASIAVQSEAPQQTDSRKDGGHASQLEKIKSQLDKILRS